MTSRPDLGERRSSRLVATAAEDCLSFRRNDADRCPLSPHKRRKSGHSLTAPQCQQRSLPPFAERKVMEYSVARRSLGLCARELDYFAPFLGIVSDELAEVGDRAGKYHAPNVGEPRLQLGISEPRIDLAIELINDLGRRVFGRTEANPLARLETRHEIAHSGDIRQCL